MWGFYSSHLKWLRTELPDWVEQGLVTPDSASAIENHVVEKSQSASYAPTAFAIMGVLMIAAGVILFFASNWQGMGKVLRLSVLFGAMWSVYGLAALAFARQSDSSDKFAHAFLLLGVLMFGANIMLIAQTYHISAHYPNGTLLWAIGALVVVYLAPSQAVAVAGVALITLWSAQEMTGFFHPTVHWPFLVLWLAFAVQAVRQTWHRAAQALAASWIVWQVVALIKWQHNGEHAVVAALLILVSVLVVLMGVGMGRTRWGPAFAHLTQRTGVLTGLTFLFVNSLSIVHHLKNAKPAAEGEFVGTHIRPEYLSPSLVIATALALVLILIGYLWLKARAESESQKNEWVVGFRGSRWDGLVVLAIVLVIIANLFISPSFAALKSIHIAFVVLNFAVIAWVIHGGYASGDRFWLNVGVGAFALALLAVYFDSFWGLMDRSVFLLVTGVMVLGGGYGLERKRRQWLGHMSDMRQGSAP